MKTVIVVRSCPDYLQLNEDSFTAQLSEPYKPHAELREMAAHGVLAVWRKYFAMSFFEYRSEIAKIARNNLAATGCEVVRTLSEFEPWLKEDGDAAVVPVDDDDWFAPEVRTLGDQFDDNTHLICWNKHTFKNYNSAKFYKSGGFRLASNNWCVRKRWLKGLEGTKAHDIILGSHRHSQTYVESHLPAEHIKVLDANLSIYVRHLGSLALLRSFIHADTLHKTLKEVSARYPTAPTVPDYFKWAEEWIERSQQLGFKMRRKWMC